MNASFAAFGTAIDTAGFDVAGVEITHGAAGDIRDGSINVENAMRYVAQQGMAAMMSAWEINSPSRAAAKISGHYMDGLIGTFYTKADEVYMACKFVAEAVNKGICEGLESGIHSRMNPSLYSVANASLYGSFNSQDDGADLNGNGYSMRSRSGGTSPIDTMRRIVVATTGQRGGKGADGDFYNDPDNSDTFATGRNTRSKTASANGITVTYSPTNHFHISGLTGKGDATKMKAMLHQFAEEEKVNFEEWFTGMMDDYNGRMARLSNV